MEKETTEENPEKKLEKPPNSRSLLVSVIQHQFDIEYARKESLRSKGTHFMTVTALIITASIPIFVFCLDDLAHPLFIGMLFILWGVLAGVSLATLLYSIRSQEDIGVPTCPIGSLVILWNKSEESTQTSIFDYFQKSINDLRSQTDKVFRQSKKSRNLLNWSIIFLGIIRFKAF